MSNSLGPYKLWLARLLFLCDIPGKNTGVGCHSLLQGVFWTQGLNPCLMFPALAGGVFTSSASKVKVQWSLMWHYRLWNQTDLDHNSSITIYQLWVILQSNLSVSQPAYLWKWAKEYLPLGSVERIKWIKKAHPYSFLGYSRHSEHYHISSTLSYSFSWFKSSESRGCFQSLIS